MNKNFMFKSVIVITIINIVAKAINFVKEILLAKSFGTGYEIDAFIIATTIPIVVSGLLASAINSSLIPVFSGVNSREGKTGMYRAANKINTLLFLLMFLVSMVGIIYPDIFIKIIAPNFIDKSYILSVKLFRITSMSTLLITMIYSYMALINTMENFIIPSLINVVLYLPLVVVLMFNNNIDIYTVTVLSVLGLLSQLLIVLVGLKKIKYKPKFIIDIKDESVSELIKLAIPAFIGNSFYQINTIIDRVLASGLGEGSIATLSYADRLNNIITSLIITSIITISYPYLAKLAANENRVEFASYSSKILIYLSLIMIPFSIGVVVFNEPIITLVYSRGQFDSESVKLTSQVMFYTSLGTFFVSCREFLFRVFFSMKDTKTSTFNGVQGVAINIVLNLLLAPLMGVKGLAFATSISAIVTTLLLVNKLSKVNEHFKVSQILKIIIKIILVSIIAIVPAFIVFNMISISLLIKLLISVVVAVVIYSVLVVLLDLGDSKELVTRLLHK